MKSAGMSELADEADSKSVDGDIVWVRPPLPAPNAPLLIVGADLILNSERISLAYAMNIE